MKRCNACDEVFEEKFSFCPVDATPLNSLAAEVQGASRAEFHLTMIDQAGLAERLAQEFRYLSLQMKVAWPGLKSDPIGFAGALIADTGKSWRRLAAPNSLAAFATAMLLVLSVGLIVVFVGNRSAGTAQGGPAMTAKSRA